jgi:hypothetical protein
VHAVFPSPQSTPPPVTRPAPETATESRDPLPPPENEAETLCALDMVTLQVVAVPWHAPPQPANDAPASGVAVSVTDALLVSAAVHVEPVLPQVMPPPLTVPGPLAETVRFAPPVNAAVTLRDAVMETVQVVAEPPHAPVQPTNVAPVCGVATSVTLAPDANGAEQTLAPLPQLIAPLPPLTLPEPVTVTLSVSACANVAVTLWSSDIVSVHEPVPLQSPPQPVNV